MNSIFNTQIQYLKGVGAKRAENLRNEASKHTLHDLLVYYTYKHIDNRNFIK